MRAQVTLTAIATLFLSLIILWNHNAVELPENIKLSEIRLGITTVAECEKIIGSSAKSHTCIDSCVYRYFKVDSIFYSREIEIAIFYRGPNTGYPDASRPVFYDGNSIIRKIEIETYPRLYSSSNNICERYAALILDWEYRTFSK